MVPTESHFEDDLRLAQISDDATSTHKFTHAEEAFFGALSTLPLDREHVDDFLKDITGSKMKMLVEQTGVAASMSANPAVVKPLGGTFISWKNVENPQSTDAIVVWCGSQIGDKDWLDAASIHQFSTWQEGYGTMHVPNLVPMRCDFKFAYVRSPHAPTPTLVATVDVKIEGGNVLPRQGHLALGDSVNRMNLIYVSGGAKTPGSVYWSKTPTFGEGRKAYLVDGYPADEMCGKPANVTSQGYYREPGQIHHLWMDVEPDTKYYYKFGDKDTGVSPVYTFRSAPSPGHQKSTKFMMIADMGWWNSSIQTMARMVESAALGFDAFACLFGDVSYARAQAWQWDDFFVMLEPLATHVPVMMSVGNHDYDSLKVNGAKDPSGADSAFHPWWGNFGDDSHGECSVPLMHRMYAPPTGHGIWWYSFDYGLVHVIQISSEHDWMEGSAQYKWLLADLAAVDRSVTPWVLLTSHRMMYTTQKRETDDYFISRMMQAQLEPVLVKFRVNVMLTGHQHSYERSCPVIANECIESGEAPVHFVIGTAGAGLEDSGFSPKFGNWSVAHHDKHGHLRVEATANTLQFWFVENVSGKVWDETKLHLWK